MRIINISISGDMMRPDTIMAGMALDNDATTLSISLPNDWVSEGSTYRLKFHTATQEEGKAYISESLTPTENVILFTLPFGLTVAGPIAIQLEGSDLSGKVIHTAIMQLHVAPSLGWKESSPIPKKE